MHPNIHITFNNLKSNIMNLMKHIPRYFCSYLLQHLANMSISDSSCGKTDSLFMHPAMLPTWFCLLLSPPSRSCLFQLFIYHRLNPPPLQLLQCLSSFTQENIMDERHDMQIHAYTYTIHSFCLLDLLLDLQAGQLAQDSHLGKNCILYATRNCPKFSSIGRSSVLWNLTKFCGVCNFCVYEILICISNP